MDWITKLERKLGKYAIKNLILYVIIAYGIGFVLNLINPAFYNAYLALDARMILHGQIWRLITWIIQPPSTNIIFIIFALYLYYFIGTSLERAWGSFRFNLYFFSGVILHIIAALLVYAFTGINFHLGTTYLNLSMFFAFAAMFPDVQLLLFFFIPIKIKWIAIVDGAFFAYSIIESIVYGIRGERAYFAIAICCVVSILNFLIFFLTGRKKRAQFHSAQRRMQQQFKQMQYQKTQNQKAGGDAAGKPAPNVKTARHRCTICGRTELTNPELDFRYCSKCAGNHEYCSDHLFTHTHLQ